MHKANPLISSACLLGVLLVTACEQSSPPAVKPPSVTEPAPAAPREDVGSEKSESLPPGATTGTPAPGFSASNCR
ncbi:hypothetical protein ACN28S_65860 [Cystobacter fuscus]